MEIIVVVAIIGIILAMVFTMVSRNIDMNKAVYQVASVVELIHSLKERAKTNTPDVHAWTNVNTDQNLTVTVDNFSSTEWNNLKTQTRIPFILAVRVQSIANGGNVTATLEKLYLLKDYPYFSSRPYRDNLILFFDSDQVPGLRNPNDLILPPSSFNGVNVERLYANYSASGGGSSVFQIIGNPVASEGVVHSLYSSVKTLTDPLGRENYGLPSIILFFVFPDIADTDDIPVMFITSKGKLFPLEAIRFVTSQDQPRVFQKRRVFGIVLAPDISLKGLNPGQVEFERILVSSSSSQAYLYLFDQVSYKTIYYP